MTTDPYYVLDTLLASFFFHLLSLLTLSGARTCLLKFALGVCQRRVEILLLGEKLLHRMWHGTHKKKWNWAGHCYAADERLARDHHGVDPKSQKDISYAIGFMFTWNFLSRIVFLCLSSFLSHLFIAWNCKDVVSSFHDIRKGIHLLPK